MTKYKAFLYRSYSMTNTKRKFVMSAYITWNDATASSSWIEVGKEEQDAEHNTALIHTMGFIVKETEQLVSVAAAISEDNMANAVITIPKVWISSIKRSKVYLDKQKEETTK